MIIGIPEALAALNRLDRGLSDQRTVMQLATGQVHRYLMGLSRDHPPIGEQGVLPVRTGRLKNSFFTQTQGGGNSVVGIVASNIVYGGVVEAHRGFLARTVQDQAQPLNDLFAAYLGRITLGGR